MATPEELEACEQRVRAMLERGGVPEPDEIEHWDTCVTALWHGPKVALIVSVDDPPYWDDWMGMPREYWEATPDG